MRLLFFVGIPERVGHHAAAVLGVVAGAMQMPMQPKLRLRQQRVMRAGKYVMVLYTIRAAYTLLGLWTYFTAGEKEIRAWTVRVGAKAPEAAGVIHSDFERGFIRAEVYAIDDLEVAGSEAGLRAAGKLRVEGKEYVLKDGDVMHFRFNV